MKVLAFSEQLATNFRKLGSDGKVVQTTSLLFISSVVRNDQCGKVEETLLYEKAWRRSREFSVMWHPPWNVDRGVRDRCWHSTPDL